MRLARHELDEVVRGQRLADPITLEVMAAAHVEKIRQGIALSDTDRVPWLRAIRDAILKWVAEHKNVVLACSALKRSYREELVVGPEVKLVYLKGNFELISSRLRARHGHFATEKLLASQFETLEEPNDAVTIDVGRGPEQIVAEIRRKLALI